MSAEMSVVCPFCGFPEECDCKAAGQGGCELTGEGEDTMCACCAIDDDAPDCCSAAMADQWSAFIDTPSVGAGVGDALRH